MNGSTLFHAGKLCFVYASAKSRPRAYEILEDCYATGDILELEWHDVIWHHKRWCIVLEG